MSLPGTYTFTLNAFDACTTSATDATTVDYQCSEYTSAAEECVARDVTGASATRLAVALFLAK